MKTLKTLLYILVLLSPSFAQTISSDHLIVHYPFDGNALDVSGNSIHGQVIGAELTEDRFGNPDAAYYFDGLHDLIDLGSNSLLKPTPPLTIAGWYYYYDVPASFFVNDFNSTNYYGLVINTTNLNRTQVSFNNGGIIGPDSRKSVFTEIPQPNQWFHFTATIDENSNVRLFVNGFEVGTNSTGYGDTLVYSNGNSYLGVFDASVYGDPYFLHGKIDDFYFYNRILSDEEIKILAGESYSTNQYTLTLGKVETVSIGLVNVPAWLAVPDNEFVQSFEIDIEGFTGDAEFWGLNLEYSTILSGNWKISTNITNEGVSIAGATSSVLINSPSGLLFELEYIINEPVLQNKIIPLNITKAIINDNSIPVETHNGSISLITGVIKYGDVDLDGQVRAIDASYILQYLTGQINLTEQQFLAADVTLDSTVSGLDAQVILDYLTGIVESLPYTPDSSWIEFDGNFYMHDITVYENEDIEIPIFVNTDSNIFSIDGEIDYDFEKLMLTDVVWSNNFRDYSKNYSATDGIISFAAFGEPYIGNDSLLTLIFRNKQYTENTAIDLKRVRVNENDNLFDAASAKINIITGIDNEQVKYDYSLQQNYPNPFNPSTTISFTISKSGNVTLDIFDVLGRRVSRLINKQMTVGKHEISFNASELNSGLYFYQISAGNYKETKKMLLMK